MNRLKSIFISAFLMAELAFLVLEINQLINKSNTLLTGISAIISLSIILLFAKFFLFKTPRTSANFPVFSMTLFLLFIGYLLWGLLNESLEFDLLIYNVIGVVGWVAYLKWYSVFPDRVNTLLKVGQQMPDLEFENTKGKTTTTKDFFGNKVIYMFYRGNWCPLCMAQIKEIAGQYKELADRGVQIVLISPQPQRHTKSLAKRFDVPFVFLRDVDHASAKELSIFQESGTPLGMEMFGYESDTVMPTVIICDEGGKIIFADLTDNYRIRPEPEVFLEILDGQV